MSGTIVYSALDARQKSILQAFERGDVWSPHYFEAYSKPSLSPGKPLRPVLFEDQVRDEAGSTIDAEFLRAALFGHIDGPDGRPTVVSERGARLSDTTVRGDLDLSSLVFAKPIVLER